ncbi:PREDICTED: uncharacterized protein LOC104595564 [Nelumbo nucifera]|uniref:Uncharacterized protein LOC104595564 n=2 Tax=Nelumbo nucifera TaxID=4432 RepID=A0A1U8A0R0_NELNU|nr:PREDICTED: uncharacterized protein LOC104595564 [Nelumbo nucifera]
MLLRAYADDFYITQQQPTNPPYRQLFLAYLSYVQSAQLFHGRFIESSSPSIKPEEFLLDERTTPVYCSVSLAAASSSSFINKFLPPFRLPEMSDPKYAYPYPAQGYYQGPPVMAPPQYAAPPPRREPGFLEGCLAALCCCCLLDECCCDPSIIFVS